MPKTIDEYIQEMKNYAKLSRFSTDYVTTFAKSSPPTDAATVGELIILVTHSRGTFPIRNAIVTVFDRDNNILKTLNTDESGRTKRITLPAVPKEFSESPNITANEIAKYYNVRIDAENFVSVLIQNIPIFEGVTSLQGYDMLYKGAANNQDLQIIELPISNV